MAKNLLVKLRPLEAKVVAAAGPFLLLAVRVIVGYGLFRLGYAKLGEYHPVMVETLKGAGIPAPELNAYVVAFCEALGGILLMLGLLTRYAAAMMIVVLSMALITVHRSEMGLIWSTPWDTVAAAPIPYLVAFLTIGVSGPGRFSLDHAWLKHTT